MGGTGRAPGKGNDAPSGTFVMDEVVSPAERRLQNTVKHGRQVAF